MASVPPPLCEFCKDNTAVSVKRYKHIHDRPYIHCCALCRDKLDEFGCCPYASSLAKRVESYTCRTAKNTSYRKSASLVDICCSVVVKHTKMFDTLVSFLSPDQVGIIDSLKHALYMNNKTRCNSKMFDKIDLHVYNMVTPSASVGHSGTASSMIFKIISSPKMLYLEPAVDLPDPSLQQTSTATTMHDDNAANSDYEDIFEFQH